jgi:7-cyano-7-deazaguanine synthase
LITSRIHQFTNLPIHQVKSAVLFSGGLDSAVLLAEEAARGDVQPIYVTVGLAWEAREREAVARLLAHEALAGAAGLVTLGVDMRDVYDPMHWAVQGTPPAYHTPDEDVYLPGRNIVLLGKAGVYSAAAGIGRLVLGTLGHNPFPDATPEFRSTMALALSLGLAHDLEVDAPYAALGKAEVIQRGAALGVPLELTMSCMRPMEKKGSGGVFRTPDTENASRPLFLHCGACSKCRERHDAFIEAAVPDPTEYADTAHITHG